MNERMFLLKFLSLFNNVFVVFEIDFIIESLLMYFSLLEDEVIVMDLFDVMLLFFFFLEMEFWLEVGIVEVELVLLD